MSGMIADCRQCEQRQLSTNLAAFGARAKFAGAGNLREKNLSAGAPFSLGPVAGPTPSYRQHTDHPGSDDQLADDQHTDDLDADDPRAPGQHTHRQHTDDQHAAQAPQ